MFACLAGTRRDCSLPEAAYTLLFALHRSRLALLCIGAVRDVQPIEQAWFCSLVRGGYKVFAFRAGTSLLDWSNITDDHVLSKEEGGGSLCQDMHAVCVSAV